MNPEDPIDGTAPWPPNFAPRSGKELPPGEVSLPIPTSIIDSFYLRERVDGPTSLVAVTECLGGGLAAFVNEGIRHLPEDLQEHLQALGVAQRDRFRAITASDLYVMSLEAVEQRTHTAGFNDPVYLYGTMHARLRCRAGESAVTSLDNEGRLVAGRLDLLHAYREGLPHRFQNPVRPEDWMHQLLVPAGPAAEVQAGRSLGLVYPILDSTMFEGADNSAITLGIAYELLTALQEDMRQAGVSDPFVDLVIAVPFRSTLEEELSAQGYVVRKDVAIAPEGAAGASIPAAGTFLRRFRQLAAQWTAPRIPVPPQATHEDYRSIIDRVLGAVASDQDRRMMKALSARVAPAVSPVELPLTPSGAGPEAAGPMHPEPSGFTGPAASARPPVVARRPREWTEDFLPPPSIRVSKQRERWWQDFDAADEGPGRRLVTSIDDWEREALREKERAASGSARVRPRDGDFSLDFEGEVRPNDAASSGSGWGGDFDSDGSDRT